MSPVRDTSGEEGLSPDDMRPVKLSRKWLERLSGREAGPVASTTTAVPQGQRNSHLTSVAGSLRRGGVSETAMLAALKAENIAKCNPPLDEAEVERLPAVLTVCAPSAGKR